MMEFIETREDLERFKSRVNKNVERWTQARRDAGFPAKWDLARQWMRGHHQFYYHPVYNEVRESKKLAKYASRWMNLMSTFIQMKVAKILAAHNRAESIPVSDTEVERIAAASENLILDDVWQRVGERELKRQAIMTLAICGDCFVRPFWDADARSIKAVPEEDVPYLQSVMMDGAEITGVENTSFGRLALLEGRFGAIGVEICQPDEFILPPGYSNFRDIRQFMRTWAAPIAWVKDLYPESGELAPESIENRRSPRDESNQTTSMSLATDSILGPALDIDDGFVVVTEYWERIRSMWRRVLFVNSEENGFRILVQDEWKDHYYTHLGSDWNTDSLYSESDAMKVMEIQRRINQSRIEQIISLRNSLKFLIVMRGKGRLEQNNVHYTLEHHAPAGVPDPSFHQIPNIYPQLRDSEMAEVESMKQMLGLYPIAFGQPKGARSGDAIGQLREEQDSIMSAMREVVDYAFLEVSENILKLANETLDGASYFGKFGDSDEAMIVTNSMLRRAPRCRLINSGVLPVGKTERFEVAMGAYDRGFFSDEHTEEANRAIEWAGGAPDELRIISPRSYAVKETTDREHRGIRSGQILVGMDPQTGEPKLFWVFGDPVVQDYQDHERELLEHIRYRQSQSVLFNWPQEDKMKLDQLIREHQMYQQQATQSAMQQMQQQQAMEAQAQGQAAFEEARGQIAGQIVGQQMAAAQSGPQGQPAQEA